MRLFMFLQVGTLAFFFGCTSGDTVQENAVEPSSSDSTSIENDLRDTVLEKEHALFRAGYADSVNAGLRADDGFKGSARREASGSIGTASITVNYGSPGKRGRVLWNGLVAYDQIWVSGSHWATAVSFSETVMVDSVRVEPGMYAFFTIPGREKWTLVLNRRYNQHLADDYDANEDIVRLEVEPTEMDTVVERLTYQVAETGEQTGELALMWDQIRVASPIQAIR